MSNVKEYLVIALVFLLLQTAYGQKEDRIWYFGGHYYSSFHCRQCVTILLFSFFLFSSFTFSFPRTFSYFFFPSFSFTSSCPLASSFPLTASFPFTSSVTGRWSCQGGTWNVQSVPRLGRRAGPGDESQSW